MSQAQASPRKTISKTLGSGISSIVGNKKTFYVLEHKTPSQRHKAGSTEEVIVNYIELGRGKDCGVRFGDDCPTVSRRHAAISRENGQYVLMNLSEVNPTILNGKRVNKRWFLQNGDQIQLSMEGPVLGFIVPTNNLTSSMSIGRRMASFRKQALRPYKTALSILAALLLIVTAGSAYLLRQSYQKEKELVAELGQAFESVTALRDSNAIAATVADSIQQANEELARSDAAARKRNRQLTRQLQNAMVRTAPPPVAADASLADRTESAPEELRSLYPNIYLLEARNIRLTKDNGEVVELESRWFGTGFLTDDGRFITARHVVEPWFYPTEEDGFEELMLANVLINNYGARISGKLRARSPNGQTVTFNLED
ncbi:MAG: FHA domain-containing protein, partial [Bacteroidota bacterium]